jgi:hypothetical protein
MPGPTPGEREELHRIASLVGLPVGVAPVGRGDDRGVIGRRLVVRHARAAGESAHDERARQKRRDGTRLHRRGSFTDAKEIPDCPASLAR